MAIEKKIPRSVGTHDGTFHADEVTACALLLLFDLIDRDKIVRTREPELLKECEYVCDVGGIYDPSQKLFDHHQIEYVGPLSSAGMVLAYLRDTAVIKHNEYDLFNNTLIKGVDAHDNGRDHGVVGLCSFSQVVSNFTPIFYDASKEVQNSCFHEALSFVFGHLKRMWERYHYTRSCREIIAKLMEGNKEVLMFDRALPWQDIFFELNGVNHPALFVIMPAGQHWKLRGIPPNAEDKMKVRLPLPLEWAGHLDEDLKKISGIPGAVFCHKGRFVSVWETKEDALKALNYILSKRKK
jgi:uncharacterized UPF0160 family protein